MRPAPCIHPAFAPARGLALAVAACVALLGLALPAARPAHAITTEALLDTVQHAGVMYFWNEANPANGLVKDRDTFGSVSSIASTGFGLSALCIGVDHGWLDRAAVRSRVLTTLNTFWTGPQGTAVNGEPSSRVPNTSNISFDGIEAESLLIALDLEGVAISTGSACSSGTLEPSHVLQAMGLPAARTRNSLRFSLGPATTADEIHIVATKIPMLVEKLRRLTRRVASVAVTR